MPKGPDGGYVPIDAATRRMIGDYIGNLIRQGGLSDAEIVEKAGIRFGQRGNLDSTVDTLPIYGILRGERRAIDAATRIQGNPNDTPGRGDLPNIQGDPADAGRFVYDVVIVATNSETGERHSDRFEIPSDTPLSLNDVRDLIESMREHYLRQIRSPAPRPGSLDDLSIDVFVIGAGRVQ